MIRKKNSILFVSSNQKGIEYENGDVKVVVFKWVNFWNNFMLYKRLKTFLVNNNILLKFNLFYEDWMIL